MTNAQLPSEIAIDYLYKVLQKIPELQLTPKNPESRTKNLLFFVGKNAKELYVIRNRESTRILIEHSLTSSITGVREDKLAAPYQGATVKKAAKGRRISVNNQHTVYVDSPESLKKLLTW